MADIDTQDVTVGPSAFSSVSPSIGPWMQPLPTAQPSPQPQSGQPPGPSAFGGLPGPAQIAGMQDKLKKIYANQFATDRSYLGRMQESQKKYDAELDQMRAREGASAAEIKPWNEQTMAPKPTSLWEKFGSPGFVLAMVASAFTAMPMNSALQAGGAAMNAINEGDALNYEKAFSAWKENTDLALKRIDLQQKEYSQIIEQRKGDLEEMRAELTIAAKKNGDQVMAAFAQEGMFPEIDKTMASIATSADDMAKAQNDIIQQKLIYNILNGAPAGPNDPVTHQDSQGHNMTGGDPGWHSSGSVQDKLDAFNRAQTQIALLEMKPGERIKYNEQKAQADVYAEQYRKNPNSFWQLPPSEQTKARQLMQAFDPDLNVPLSPPGGWLKVFGYDEKGANALADYYRITGTEPPLTGFGENVGNAKIDLSRLIAKRMSEDAPIEPQARKMSSEQAQYKGTVSGARILGHRSANVETAASTLEQAIPQALNLSKMIPRERWVPLNAAQLWAYRQGSDVKISQWDVANLQVVEAYARLINPQSNTIREDIFNVAVNAVNQAKSPEAYAAIMRSLATASQLERQGLAVARNEQIGLPAKIPDPNFQAPPNWRYSPSRGLYYDQNGNAFDLTGQPYGR